VRRMAAQVQAEIEAQLPKDIHAHLIKKADGLNLDEYLKSVVN